MEEGLRNYSFQDFEQSMTRKEYIDAASTTHLSGFLSRIQLAKQLTSSKYKNSRPIFYIPMESRRGDRPLLLPMMTIIV
jgi:hypothetical protein